MNTVVTYALILFGHVGPMGNGNSNTLAVLPGFTTQAECEIAGKAARNLVKGSVKELEFVCVKQTRVGP